jgi:hypothetical protein
MNNKFILKFKEDGECFSCTQSPDNLLLEDNEEVVESEISNCNFYHKEPYKTKFNTEIKLEKIRLKRNEILKNHDHIYGLSIGENNDDAWKAWAESLITFTESYKDRVIEENEIVFPKNPRGEQENLNLLD